MQEVIPGVTSASSKGSPWEQPCWLTCWESVVCSRVMLRDFHQSLQWPPLTTCCCPGGQGCSWSQVKERGKTLSARSQRDRSLWTIYKGMLPDQKKSPCNKNMHICGIGEVSLGLSWGCPAETQIPPAPGSATRPWNLLQLGKNWAQQARTNSPISLCPAFQNSRSQRDFQAICLGAYLIPLQFLLPEAALESATPASTD